MPNTSSPTAFVTGGTGFLGLHLVRLLRQRGWRVLALHRAGSDTGNLVKTGAEPLEGILHDTQSLLPLVPEHCDAVFHLAGNTSLWRRRHAEQIRDNVDGTRALLQAARQRRVGRFIYTSSISAWGFQDTVVTEKTPQHIDRHSTNYARSKFLAEQEVRAAEVRGLDTVILNPCGIMGMGDRHNWSQMIQLIDQGKLPGVPPGGGNFCRVQEVALAHLAAFERGRRGHNYILAGVEASFLELATVIADTLGRKAPRRTLPRGLLHVAGHLYPLFAWSRTREPSLTPEKVSMVTRRVRADGRKAVHELGFNDRVPLEIMVCECIEWMRALSLL